MRKTDQELPNMKCKQIRALIKDEGEAVSTYRRVGLPGIMRDEMQHKETLRKMLRKCRR